MALSELIHQRWGIEDEEWLREMDAVSTKVTLKRHDVIVDIGEVQPNIIILISGAMGAYKFVDGSQGSGGKSFIECITTKPGDVCVCESDLTAKSSIRIEALITSEVYQFPTPIYFDWYRKYPEAPRLLNQLNETSIRWSRFTASMRMAPPEQRYKLFLEEHGEAGKKIPNKDIAKYLGISEQWMSKIAKL